MDIKTNSKLLPLLCLSLAFVIAGCGSLATENVSDAGTESGTEVAASTSSCCGQCTTEASDAQSDGCCGKCAEEQQAISTGDETCGNCTACAEGDSDSCKCGGASVQPVSNETEPQASVEHVPGFAEDRDTFHFLLSNHDQIERHVTELENGVETLTESSDPQISAKIQEHVASMYQRVEDARPIRMRDPLYRELFQHTDKIEMTIENTANGIRVTETSADEYVVKLIKAHAKVVSGFAERGFEEARENHQPPKK